MIKKDVSLTPVPKEIGEQLIDDMNIYGTGIAERMEDGTWRRIDPTKVVFAVHDKQVDVYGMAYLTPKDPDAKES